MPPTPPTWPKPNKAGKIATVKIEYTWDEQMFVTPTNPGEAISAVKAISKAVQAGQRIYTINATNMATVLPNINQSPFVLNEITNAVNAGFEVITHTDAVSVPGWSGAGYIILDAETGDGVYKIESGINGSILTVLSILLSSIGTFWETKFKAKVCGLNCPPPKTFLSENLKKQQVFGKIGKALGLFGIALSLLDIWVSDKLSKNQKIAQTITTVLTFFIANAAATVIAGFGWPILLAAITAVIVALLLTVVLISINNKYFSFIFRSTFYKSRKFA